MDQEVIGVKEFIGVLNETLGFAFPQVVVEGEVSSFKVNQGKWVFFDLKDQDATLPCFMPVFQLKVPLEDGMRVRVAGTPKLTNWGKFSFTARSVELAGEGEIKRAFELLKAKLQTEGLFDPARKRLLPKFPKRIGLVTSGTSAAFHDFVKILHARWGGVEVLLADVQVQGAAAPDQVTGALAYLNQLPEPVDVIVVIRGGGSLEDLQAFSTEQVARAVASSRTPTLVGVGHEVDVSLADYAADVRAATPTDAARLVVPDRQEILQAVMHNQTQITSQMNRQVLIRAQLLDRQLALLVRFIQEPRDRLMRAEAVLHRRLDGFSARIATYQESSSRAAMVIQAQMSRAITYRRKQTEALMRILKGFDPKGVLARGYAIVSSGGAIVKTADQVTMGDHLMIQLAQGKLSAKVDDE
jgi:exodeoxyribonuclease VII large subunit